MALTMSEIFDLFTGENLMFRKAEKLYKAGHLYEFEQDCNSFTAKVMASMKATTYSPKVSQ
jgi:hypothetical protein